MEKKKILFTAKDLKIGGIEKALVTLLNYLVDEYDITLVLEKKEGELLRQLDYKVKVEEYTPSEIGFMPVRKIINFINRLKAIHKYKNKFNTSVSFATYSLPGSFIARISSKNSVLWGHANYLDLFQNNRIKMKEFFDNLKYNEFSKIVFVSREGMYTFVELFPEIKKKVYYCNNLIDAKNVERLSNQSIDMSKDSEVYTFLNVGRHDEKQKKLSRIIKAAEKLKEENYKFKILLVGEGKDTEIYKQMVKKSGLEEQIIFLGKKENPYPYFNISDCVVLSSDYEGYPVVFLESFILNKPIITTDVSDYEDVKNGRGIVVNKNWKDIYISMKRMIDDGYNIENKFDQENYNIMIKNNLKNILE